MYLLCKKYKIKNKKNIVMKKFIVLLFIASLLTVGITSKIYAQDKTNATQTEQEAVADDATKSAVALDEDALSEEEQVAAEEIPLHQQLKIKFIEGGPMWMAPLLLCLIIGLAVALERIIYLNLATVNTKKLLTNVEEALNDGGIEAAKEVCRKTRGPVASIFYQGLDRYSEGLETVEKSVVSYGSVQVGLMEKGLSWVSLFIALAPMLGFLGTVVGMIQAFDAIQMAGDISPTLVAGGMKVALITTVGGLIVAMILQVFFNYILSKIEGVTSNMEDASISLMDILTDFSKKNVPIK
jgi:biopolymer transport protein ExbB